MPRIMDRAPRLLVVYDLVRRITPFQFLTGITIIGIVLRLVVASTLAVDRDEGEFVYQAQLALHGSIPLRDIIPPPDPLYVWLVAFMELLLGPNLLTVRLLSVMFSAVAIVALYLVTCQFARKRIALLASLVYSLSPTIILYNAVGNYRQVAWPLVIVALYFLLIGIKSMNWRPLLVFGALVGLATMTYRVSGIFLITCPILLVLLHRHRPGNVWKLVAAAISGGLTTTLPIIGFIVFLSNLQWINRVWGFGGGVGSASNFAVGPSGSGNIFQDSASHFDFLSRIGFVVTREWLYLLLLAALGAVYLVKSNGSRNLGARPLLLLMLVLGCIMVSRGQALPPNPDFGAYLVWPPYDYVSILLVWLGVWAILRFSGRVVPGTVDFLAGGLILYWTMTLVVAFSLFNYFHVFYFIAFGGPITILSAFGIHALLHCLRLQSNRWHSQRIFSAFILCLVVSSTLVAAWSMYTTSVQERDVSILQANSIGTYLRNHTLPTDEILTGNLIYAVTSGRNNALRMSNIYVYFQTVDDPFPGNPFNSTPSISQLVARLAIGSVKYVVMDPLLFQVAAQHPILQDAINSHFSLDTTMYGVSLFKFMS